MNRFTLLVLHCLFVVRVTSWNEGWLATTLFTKKCVYNVTNTVRPCVWVHHCTCVHHYSVVVVVVVVMGVCVCVPPPGPGSVLLRDVQVLTLQKDRFTAGGRSAPVPQLRCLGGSAGCGAFVPEAVQCHNKGWDGVDVQVRHFRPKKNIYIGYIYLYIWP